MNKVNHVFIYNVFIDKLMKLNDSININVTCPKCHHEYEIAPANMLRLTITEPPKIYKKYTDPNIVYPNSMLIPTSLDIEATIMCMECGGITVKTYPRFDSYFGVPIYTAASVTF